MVLKKIFYAVIVFTTVLGFSQNRDTSFIKVYSGSGYDYSRDIIQLADSNFVITGSSSSFPSANADVLLMKVGHYGDVIWSEAYGGAGDDWGTQVSELPDSSLIVSGYTNSFGQGGFDFYLLKTDSTGNLKWSKTFGGFDWDLSHAHIIAEDNDIILVGETQSFGSGKKDIMLVRTDSMGNEKWRKYYGGTENDVAYDIAHNPSDSTLYLAGVTESFGNQEQGYLLKLDYDGDTIFTKVMGGAFDDGFRATKINFSLGEWIACGYEGLSEVNKDYWFVSIDPTSGIINFNVSDGGNDGVLNEIVYDFDLRPILNEIYYGGITTSYGLSQIDGEPDFFLGNRNATGGWLNYYNNNGEQGYDDIRSLKYCKQDGIVAVGNTEFFSNSENGIFIIRIDLLKNFPVFNITQNNPINSSIKKANTINTIKYYPNPVNDKLNIELPDEISDAEIVIYTTDGKCLDKIRSVDANFSIATRDWENGIYFFQVFEAGQLKGNFKISK